MQDIVHELPPCQHTTYSSFDTSKKHEMHLYYKDQCDPLTFFFKIQTSCGYMRAVKPEERPTVSGEPASEERNLVSVAAVTLVVATADTSSTEGEKHQVEVLKLTRKCHFQPQYNQTFPLMRVWPSTKTLLKRVSNAVVLLTNLISNVLLKSFFYTHSKSGTGKKKVNFLL